MEGLSLTFEGAREGQTGIILPRLDLTRPANDKVEETVLETSILMPFRDTRFVVQVSISQAWSRMKTDTVPETWWTLEFYGRHWGEALNHVSPGERRKDWGEELGHIWPGGDATLEDRFGEFLQHVIMIQSALDRVDWN